MAWKRISILLLAGVAGFSNAPADDSVSPQYDPDRALLISQAAVGNRIPDLTFTGLEGQPINLAEYRGKPLVISLVYTSCPSTCLSTTAYLKHSVRAARRALGDDSFNVVSIGFDSPVDTPERMAVFARQQNVHEPGWAFLSGKQQPIQQLADSLGFTWAASARGFDHISQASIIDGNGVLYRQVYGQQFELPWLVEPLKDLVYDRPAQDQGLVANLVAKVKLFCTVYDPGSGRYRFDYSLFVQIVIGLAVLLSIGTYLYRESRMRS